MAGLVFFISNFFANTVVDEMLSVSVINDSNATREALLSFNTQANRFDSLGLGLLIGLILFVIISGWLVGGHPVFMMIYFFIVMIAVAVSTVFANVWESVTSASVFGATIGNFPIMNHVFTLFPVYIAIIGIVGLVVMFSRSYSISNSGGQSGGGGHL